MKHETINRILFTAALLVVALGWGFVFGEWYREYSHTDPCHCHYRTTDDRFRTGYTKANKPCEPQPNGHVKIGDTVYTNITEYRCE
jgi:hypothetical protein